MAKRSKRINLADKNKEQHINPETLKFFQKYQIDMSIRDLSPKTITNYNSDLMQWFIYMYDNQFNLSVLDATDEDIEEYYFWRKQQGNNVNRQKRVMSSISAFYKFLRKKKFIKESPVEFIERPKNAETVVKQTFLTIDQVNELRAKLKEENDLQLETYILFGLSTMARVNAISHLRWEQIDLENRFCSDVHEKEGKIVELYFSQEVQQLLIRLKKYREDNKINDYGWVFISPYVNEEECISNGTLNAWCKRVGELIGIPTLHNHDLRHSGSNLLRDQGMELQEISELLHHESTETTVKHYLTVNKQKIQANKDKYSF